MSLNGSYTLGPLLRSRRTRRAFNQTSAGYLKPDDPSNSTPGHCVQDRRHLATLTVGYLSPGGRRRGERAVVSNWRLSGLVSARTGDRLNIIDR